jgi:hypothetical protein
MNLFIAPYPNGEYIHIRDNTIHNCGEFFGQTEEGSPYPEGITVDSFMGL